MGGGISNGGTVELTNSTVSNNSSAFAVGGIFSSGVRDSSGYSVERPGTLTITNTTISKNSGASIGGIYHQDGTLTLNNSTVFNNRASSKLGGTGGIRSSTAAVSTTDPNPSERTTIKNSTISGNSANSSAIYNEDGLMVIENSTITKNTAPDGQGSGVQSSSDTDTRTSVRASIISGNSNTDVDSRGSSNTFRSKGSNLIGDGNATGAFNKPGDKTNVSDPGLGALARNSGPTKTHALLKGSPAIDAVVGTCPPPATDQRGASRPQDGDGNGTAKCDIGSFELKAVEVIRPPPPSDPPPPPKPPAKNPNACTIKGNVKNNVLKGTPKRDVICGFGGNDIIQGLGGNDLIKSGGGNDTIQAGNGNDVVYGGSGKDTIQGQDGDDNLHGQDGGDILQGGDGNDRLYGGSGEDTLQGGDGRDVLRGGLGKDVTRQ